MKHIYKALLALAFILPLASCSGFWGDKESDLIYYESMADVHSIQNNAVVFKSNPNLYFKSQENFHLDDSISLGDRVWLYFTIVDSLSPGLYDIHVYSYSEVVSRSLVRLEKNADDSIQSMDLFKVHKCWISNNYLNLIFYAYSSFLPNSSFELVRDMTREDTLAAKPKVYLELRHNTASVTPHWYNLEMMSFDLKPIRDQYPGQDTIAVRFSYKIGSTQNVSFYYFPEEDEDTQE